MLFALFIISLIVPTAAFAAGGHGEVSYYSLIPAFANFFIIFGFILFKVKGSIRQAFVQKAEKYEQDLLEARKLFDEATQIEKDVLYALNNFDQEKAKIKQEVESDFEFYVQETRDNFDKALSQFSKDCDRRVQAEQENLQQSLCRDLVSEVTTQAKGELVADENSDAVFVNKFQSKEVRA